MTPDQRIEALEDRVAFLEDALGFSYNAPPEIGLTQVEERILGVILKSRVATKERLFAAIWGDDNDPPEEHVLAVHAHRIRRKLAAHGIAMHSMYRVGYYIPADQKATLLAAQ